MTHHVQEFIESTIDLIEKQEYHEVFTIWYLHYSIINQRQDQGYLFELFEIFDEIEIDLYTESEPARKDIVSEHMYNYIEDVLTNDPDASEITLPTVINHLSSKLGVSLIELKKLFEEVANQLIQTGAKIKLEPFKIHRI